MRRCALPICACVLWLGVCAEAATFPFEGIVQVNDSLRVRSGPSERYYRTGLLKPNDRVTVLRQQGEWLAIRPPEGSFSWVSGQFVRQIGPDEGEIMGQNVNVRVGTLLSERLRDTVQVQLTAGTVVKILQTKTFNHGPLAQTWHKIAPPADEVRWVHGRFIQRSDGRAALSMQLGAGAGTVGPSGPRALGSIGSGRQPASRWTASYYSGPSPVSGSGPVEPPVSSENSKSQQRTQPSSGELLQRAEAVYAEVLRHELRERDLDSLSQLFQQAALEARSQAAIQLIGRRLEAIERQKQRQAKLGRFERIVRRSRQRDQELLSRLRHRRIAPAQSRFDGNGVLRKSAVQIDGESAFVLVGPQGGLRYYVTPATGLELGSYLGQRIAVRGVKRYRPELRQHHIVVREIVPISLSSRIR